YTLDKGDIALQSKKAEQIALEIINEMVGFSGDRMNNPAIHDVTDEPYQMFNITLEAYNYFYLTFSYNRSIIGCSGVLGKCGIELENSQQWYDKVDMNMFLKELQQQLELRIPDKFLEYNGWK